ncbi:Molybdopterin-binding protein [Halanaeroarchaeum sp. HSR-CO]|uniref:TOBE domain-containing protein n=1 Tax=Halanaeroarchaeum sp. HSR-CO TaxID=2866382 RepID=UPI00217D730E|nr:TOBE domain-containing protein [Halanaeroarchaeum sp. HSR-CO]UWG48555.1 Molybdopterin-binding protein [Halanaeroarchaeum sp. HSR-CO]
MTVEDSFEPLLSDGETTVTERDVRMLRAIDRTGSMSQAAEELGRSYPHLQRRVVELEAVFGDLTSRSRGGRGGGGTALTEEARTLIRRFERLRSELGGVTAVAESVISGTVVERHGELAIVDTDAGTLTVRAPARAERVEIAIRADAVVLVDSDSPSETRTSLRNQLTGTISSIDRRETTATVTVDVGSGVEIDAVVTTESVDRLGLEVGAPVVAAFKSTAARATPADV